MTSNDLSYIKSLSQKGLIKNRVLELGGGYGGATCREAIIGAGLKYFATDMHAAPGVDYVADFETGAGIQDLVAAGPFGTVLILNVLEHTFNPIAILDNALRVIEPGGTIITVTPAIWPLHNYPVDCCRLLPDWYRRFAASRSLALDEETFAFITAGGQPSIGNFRSPVGQDSFPPPSFHRQAYTTYSRIVHKLFNTFGRGMMFQSHIAIGAVFSRQS
jgi:2-polyprenyl-3-methyl-5-hydroxy-6-metoxy-1,4-benzoquinol methylase